MLLQIYDLLLGKYGPQGWWPVTPEGESLPRYSGGPVNPKQRFEVVVGAILTQNTSWKNVEKAIVNLNKNSLIIPGKIKDMPVEELAQLIRPSGYFNQKAERLRLAAVFFLNLKNKSPAREQLLGLKGIGPETADSILLYAFDKPFFVIDAYTRRIFSRIGFRADSYGSWQSLFHSALDKDPYLFQEYHALLVEHAKQFCTKVPACDSCPLSVVCKKFI